MIVSRGRSILRLCTKTRSLLSNIQLKECTPKKWHSEYNYRNAPDIEKMSKRDSKCVEYLTAFFWWWVFWHFFTEYEALIGPAIPDPEKWTDEELGVPPL